MSFSRRDFMIASAMASMAAKLEAQQTRTTDSKAARTEIESSGQGFGPGGKKPIMISSANGWNGADEGYQMLKDGKDTLDAAIHLGVTQENDVRDTSVGKGGLPNEDGVVELDSSCMHGPSRRGGAVGGVRNIKNVSLLAKAVMEHTGHVMLVGEGAEKFGYAMGFPKEDLLTEDSRKTWMMWKEFHTDQDWWGPGLSDPNWKAPSGSDQPDASLYDQQLKRLEDLAEQLNISPDVRAQAIQAVLHPPHGTIHCSAMNEKGDISGMTTTAGLAWKVPGRCGDSPIIGAGCFTDPDVGSAGATGSGEENIKVAGAHSIVELMRKGAEPKDAGIEVLKRIAKNHNNDMSKIAYIDMIYYILRNDGAYAGATLWSGPPDRRAHFMVHDGNKRLEPAVALYNGVGKAYPPHTPQPQRLR